jgi:hypothetical protein
MENAIFREYELYCPVCDHTFKQLIVLHKLPEEFDVTQILADAVGRHDHKAYQDYKKAQMEKASDGQQEKTE